MRTNTIISQLTNENHMIKVKYNELFQHCKELEEKIKELESRLSHIESIPSDVASPHPPLCPCARLPCPSSPSEPINYTTIIQTLESKILELNKHIIQQNKNSMGR
jgi:hypothetical protein